MKESEREREKERESERERERVREKKGVIYDIYNIYVKHQPLT